MYMKPETFDSKICRRFQHQRPPIILAIEQDIPNTFNMADPDTLIKAKIHYFCRERQFHAMQFAAVEGMKRFSGDPAFKFFYGMALVLEGQLQVKLKIWSSACVFQWCLQ